MIIGALVLAWGGLLVGLVLLNDSKPLGDKLEAFLTGLSLLVAGAGYLSVAAIGRGKAKEDLANTAD